MPQPASERKCTKCGRPVAHDHERCAECLEREKAGTARYSERQEHLLYALADCSNAEDRYKLALEDVLAAETLGEAREAARAALDASAEGLLDEIGTKKPAPPTKRRGLITTFEP